MRKLLFFVSSLLLGQVSHAAFTTDWLRNTTSTITLNGTTYYWQAGTGSFGQVLQTDGAARPTLTWGTSSGGGGGSSSLAVDFNGTQISSPTSTLNFMSPLTATLQGSTSVQITLSGNLPGNSTSYIQNTLTPTTATQQFSVALSSSVASFVSSTFTLTDKNTAQFTRWYYTQPSGGYTASRIFSNTRGGAGDVFSIYSSTYPTAPSGTVNSGDAEITVKGGSAPGIRSTLWGDGGSVPDIDVTLARDGFFVTASQILFSPDLTNPSSFSFFDSDNSNYVSFQGSSTISSDISFTWPVSNCSSGQFLTIDVTGAFVCATPAGGGGLTGLVSLSSQVIGVLPYANGGTSTSTTFTDGSIIFAGASSFVQNNSKFFFDNTNIRQGIGTNTPIAKLHLEGKSGADGDGSTNGAIEISDFTNGGFSHALAIGISSVTEYGWIQGRFVGSGSNKYDLMLNPEGANVRISTNVTDATASKLSIWQLLDSILTPSGQTNTLIPGYGCGDYQIGDTTQYRIYAYKTILNVRVKSLAAQTGSDTALATGDAFDIQWVDNDSSEGFIVLRNKNGDGFNSYTDVTSAGFVDSENCDIFWKTGTGPDYPDVNEWGFSRYNYNDLTNFWGSYGGSVFVSGRLGISENTPEFQVHMKTSLGDGFVIDATEHTSTITSELRIRDSRNEEVVGLAAWNGGLGAGGYGVTVLSSSCNVSGCFIGELSGKNTNGGFRIADIVYSQGTARDLGQITMHIGRGSGAFATNVFTAASNGTRWRTTVGIAAGSGTDLLHIAAGGTTDAPIRLTSGSLPTGSDIRAGQIAFLTDKMYAAITTGPLQKEFTLNDAALTLGRVPYVHTNGRLIDTSQMTYSTTTATLTISTLTANGFATIGGTATGQSTISRGLIVNQSSGSTVLDGLQVRGGTVTLANLLLADPFTNTVTMATATVNGKLTVTGALDPISLTLSSNTAFPGATMFIASANGIDAATATVNTGRLRYNNTVKLWQQSADTSGWVSFSTTTPTTFGSGAAARVPFWSDANTLSSNSSFTFTTASNFLGVGFSAAASYPIEAKALHAGGPAAFTGTVIRVSGNWRSGSGAVNAAPVSINITENSLTADTPDSPLYEAVVAGETRFASSRFGGLTLTGQSVGNNYSAPVLQTQKWSDATVKYESFVSSITATASLSTSTVFSAYVDAVNVFRIRKDGNLFVVMPATQTIVAGSTVTANGCGTIKRLSSAGAVTTSTARTFDMPTTGENDGCIMHIINTGANNITLDNNATFKSSGGADVILTPDDSVIVGSVGTFWYQLGPLVAN